MQNDKLNHTASYETIPKIYGVLSEIIAHEATFRELEVKECFEEEAHGNIRPGLGSYKITITATVSNRSQFNDFEQKAQNLAQLLDFLWIYVTGVPLSVHYHGKIIEAYEVLPPPDGWNTNSEEVNRQIKSNQKYSINIASSNVMWSWIPELPLKSALNAVEAYESVSEEICALVELHYNAWKSNNLTAKLFFFAKALELAFSILPGKRKNDKEKKLNEEVGDVLCNSLNRLLDISNNRREIRHIVKNPTTTELHTKLSENECSSFCKDVDMIIKFIVCTELNLPLQITKDGEPPD